jgi:hypothetical protein
MIPIEKIAVADRIISHLKLAFVADKPPPTHLAYQEVPMAAEWLAGKAACCVSRQAKSAEIRKVGDLVKTT